MSKQSIADRVVELAQGLTTSAAERGELDVLLDRHLNTASTKQMRSWLYDRWSFPKRFIKEQGKNTTSLAVAVDAILANYRLSRDRRLELCLLLSDRKTQLEVLATKLDKDGRVRFTLKIAGTKVGRLSCDASLTGSGFNMQTVSERHRHLYPAGPGNDFYSVDLKGADGWTIGAECAALGDPRMLEDLRAGLKPANAVTMLLMHGPVVNEWPMDQALEAQAKLDKKDWRYKACKSAVWGTCYGEGDVKLSESILEGSWKDSGELFYVSAADCKRLQAAVHARYPGIRRRMDRIKMLLERDGALSPCEGLPPRDFFGVKTDHATQKQAFAYAPAFVTAYADHLALRKLWHDPDRVERGVKPRLPVHDSICFEAPQAQRAWVAGAIPRWFDNPVRVAGTTLTIPYEAKAGPSWGDLHQLDQL